MRKLSNLREQIKNRRALLWRKMPKKRSKATNRCRSGISAAIKGLRALAGIYRPTCSGINRTEPFSNKSVPVLRGGKLGRRGVEGHASVGSPFNPWKRDGAKTGASAKIVYSAGIKPGRLPALITERK